MSGCCVCVRVRVNVCCVCAVCECECECVWCVCPQATVQSLRDQLSTARQETLASRTLEQALRRDLDDAATRLRDTAAREGALQTRVRDVDHELSTLRRAVEEARDGARVRDVDAMAVKAELAAAKAAEAAAVRELDAARQAVAARERDHAVTLAALREELHALRLELRGVQDAATATGNQLRGEVYAAQGEVAALTVRAREQEAGRRAAEKQAKVCVFVCARVCV